MKAYGSKKFGKFYGAATNINGPRWRRKCPCCQVTFVSPSKKAERRNAKADANQSAIICD